MAQKDWKRRKLLENKYQIRAYINKKNNDFGVFIDNDQNGYKVELMEDENIRFEEWFKKKSHALKEAKLQMSRNGSESSRNNPIIKIGRNATKALQ